MDAILAMASLHRHRLVSSSGAPPRQVTAHWQRCLSDFASRLTKGFDGDDADAMLATATLINGVAFALVDHQVPSKVWPLASNSSDLEWLYRQKGITIVYAACPFVRPNSALKQLFDVDPFDDLQDIAVADENILRDRLASACVTGDSEQNVYDNALQVLGPLLRLPCTSETILMHLGFIGLMNSEFIALLREKNHIALLILSYWYAGICSFDCWWVTLRPALECVAICKYLDQHATQIIRDLLFYPAEACGYSLQAPLRVQERLI